MDNKNNNIISTELIIDDRLQFKGGKMVALLPFALFVAGCFVLAVLKLSTIEAYWINAMICLSIGMFLSKKPALYFDAIRDGMAQPLIMVGILCWVWAGVFAAILKVSGLVEGLIWVGLTTHLTGGAFVAFTFLLGSVYGSAVGSGWATITAFSLLLYPAGIALGANPIVLAGAIISAGCFGDNIAPVSDTTIIAAVTQDADVPGVVKSRLPYVVIAGSIAVVAFFILGGGGDSVVSPEQYNAIIASASPKGLIMLIPAAIVIILAFKGKTLLEAVSIGIISEIVVGMASGLITFDELINVTNGNVGGALVDGILGFANLIVLVLLVTALSYTMQASGAISDLLNHLRENVIKTVTHAELVNYSVVAISAFALSNSVIAEVVAAPIVKIIGKDFNISRYRLANFIDSVHCMFSYTVPWAGATMLFISMTKIAAETYTYAPVFTNPLSFTPYVFYAWTLGGVFLISAITGIGRKHDTVEIEKYEKNIVNG
jgi:Na+/H+ antiporter NhaC